MAHPADRRLRARPPRRRLRADPTPRLERAPDRLPRRDRHRRRGLRPAPDADRAWIPFGATSTLPSDRAWAEGVGLLIWMIGLWLVAARYRLQGRSARSGRPRPRPPPRRPARRRLTSARYPRSAMADLDTPLRPRRRDALLRGARRPVLCRRRRGPGPAAGLPGGRPGRRPQRRLTPLPHPVLGRPARRTTTSAATRACGCATSRSRSARPSATAGSSTCAPRSPPVGAAGRRRRASSSATSRWPPRRCATATEASLPAFTPSPLPPSRRSGPVHCPTARGERRADWRRRPRRPIDGPRAADREAARRVDETPQRGKTVHGEPANAGHRVLAPDDAEVEAYLETALKAPAPERSPGTTSLPARTRRPRDRRRPRLRQPVRPADRAARPRARRLLGAPAARHAVSPSSSGAARARSSCRAARTRSTTRTRRDPTRPSGPAGSPSSASATAPS